MRAAADDDDVVGALELGLAAPHPPLAEDVKHRRRLPRRSGAWPARRRRPAGRRGASPASATTTRCTRRSPSRTGTGSGPRPRGSGSPAGGRSSRAAARRRGVTCGRRSSAQKRANTSRASGPASVSARELGASRRDVPARAGGRVGEPCAAPITISARVGGQPAPPGAVERGPRCRTAQRCPRRVERSARALELELAQVRDVGPADGPSAAAPRRPSCRSRRRRSSRRGPRSARPRRAALRSIGERATGSRRPPDGVRKSRLTSAAPRRRGRRTAWSGSRRRAALPSSEIVIRAPSWASASGTQAIPIVRPSTGEWRELVTWPAGVAALVDDHRALGRHVAVGEREADQRGRRRPLGVVLERPLADEVLLLVELDDPRHRGAERRRLRVGVLADEDVHLLQAQDPLGLQPERPQPVRLAGLDAARPRGARRRPTGSGSRSRPRRRTRSAGSGTHAGDRRLLAVEVRERLVGAVEVGDRAP